MLFVWKFYLEDSSFTEIEKKKCGFQEENVCKNVQSISIASYRARRNVTNIVSPNEKYKFHQQ